MTVYKHITGEVECIRHFLYFPTRELAEAAGKIAAGHGRSLEISSSGYNAQWLLLVTEKDRGEEAFDHARACLTEVAESLEGEYDGWEYEIRNMIH